MPQHQPEHPQRSSLYASTGQSKVQFMLACHLLDSPGRPMDVQLVLDLGNLDSSSMP